MNETLSRILYKEKNEEISHTKLWSNIGYFIITITFICVTISMGLGYTYPIDDWLELFVTFGALVAIPRGFSKWIDYRKGKITNGGAIEPTPDPK